MNRHIHCTLQTDQDVEINVHEKMLFLTAMHLQKKKVEIFSLVSDLSFFLENVGRLVGAMEQIALLEKNYWICGWMVMLRMCLKRRIGINENREWMNIHKHKDYDNYKFNDHVSRSNDYKINDNYKINYLTIKDRKCTVLHIKGSLNESYTLFLYKNGWKEPFFSTIFHNKTIIYFCYVIQSVKVIMISDSVCIEEHFITGQIKND